MKRAALKKPGSQSSTAAPSPVVAGLKFTVQHVCAAAANYHRSSSNSLHSNDSANIKEAVSHIAREVRDFLHKPLCGGIVPRRNMSDDRFSVDGTLREAGHLVQLSEYYVATITIPDVNRLRNPHYREAMLKPPMVALLESLKVAMAGRSVIMAASQEPYENADIVGAVSTDGYIATRAVIHYDWDINGWELVLDALFGVVKEPSQ